VAKVTLRKAVFEDTDRLIKLMRADDVRELTATCGHDRIGDPVRWAVGIDPDTLCAEVDGELVGLFGFLPALGYAIPWLLATPLLDKYPLTLCHQARIHVSAALAKHKRLVNFVDARNTRSIRWLRSLGFEIHPAVAFGALRMPFHKFTMGR
jgi:hypothetical protein